MTLTINEGKSHWVLGVDPSTKTGISVIKFSALGHRLISSSEISSKGSGIARAMGIAEQVRGILSKYPVNLVAIEGYGFANTHTLALLVEIGTLIRREFMVAGVTYHEIAPTALKKFVTGTGIAKKDKMAVAIFKKWNFEGTDNEVDAFGLAMFGGALLGYVQLSALHMAPVLKVGGKKN